MSVSKQAGTALSLLHGIDLVKDPSAFSWRSIATRILIDADERDDTVTVAAIGALLARLWDDLPDAGDGPEARALLARMKG